MRKKLGIFLYLIFFILVVPFIFGTLCTSYSTVLYSQTISFSDRKVIYDLPYPGILPDHPLYPVKMVRDRLLDLVTRENIKKAELYFLFSDKRAAMAISLANSGKSKLAISTLTKGEKYFLKIPALLSNAKKQGSSAPESLIYKLKLSNDKHREIIDEITKKIPQGQEKDIEYLLEINGQIRNSLNKF